MSGAKRQRDPDTSTQLQSTSQRSAATLKPVLKEYGYDFEVAVLHDSPDHQSPQQLPQLSGLDEVNNERSWWAPPGSTDVERMSSFIQAVLRRSLAQHEQSGTTASISQHAIFAPDRKALRQRQAELGLTLRAESNPAGEEELDMMLQEPRDMPQAEDQTPQIASRSSCQQVAPTAAEQHHSAQAAGSLLQPNSDGTHTCVQQQRHLDRIGSKSGSTLTQLATALPRSEARLHTEDMPKDMAAPQQTNTLKSCEPWPHSCANERPAGAALNKVPSVNSRANPFLSTPAAGTLEHGENAAASAQAAHPAKGTAARMGLHGRTSERPLHGKRPLGPSRLGKGKQCNAQPNAMSAVTGSSDQNQSKISGFDNAPGVGSVPDTAGASKGQKTASAR